MDFFWNYTKWVKRLHDNTNSGCKGGGNVQVFARFEIIEVLTYRAS